MFSYQTLILGGAGLLIFLVFRLLSNNSNRTSPIIYIIGLLCLAISIYIVGLMFVDISISKYFDILDANVYKLVTMWIMIAVSLGSIFLVAIVDPIAYKLRKGE
jgi:hypothetical protein